MQHAKLVPVRRSHKWPASSSSSINHPLFSLIQAGRRRWWTYHNPNQSACSFGDLVGSLARQCHESLSTNWCLLHPCSLDLRVWATVLGHHGDYLGYLAPLLTLPTTRCRYRKGHIASSDFVLRLIVRDLGKGKASCSHVFMSFMVRQCTHQSRACMQKVVVSVYRATLQGRTTCTLVQSILKIFDKEPIV